MTPERWRKIEELYNQTLSCAPAGRMEFLAAECGGDEELRRRVEMMLAQSSSDGILDGPAAAALGESLAESGAGAGSSLSPGDLLGPYRIVGLVGSGGMGQVYRAHDPRLRRDIAVKVLSPEVSLDPARRQRFEREARAVAALNHPGIVTIHDISRAGDTDFIAMELVAGQSLDQLIPRDGLKVTEALQYAVQIADALAAAHAAGVIHRDLKPANVMVSATGAVKVLDFGLAKLEKAAPGGIPDTAELTQTEAGTVLGTAPYMSPEQVEGRAVDARSDIFSFGALIYEMLSGRRAFRGDSTMSTMAAVLNREPEPLASGIPPELARLVERCLRKDPSRRAQSMADVSVTLQEIAEPAVSPRSRRRILPIALTLVAILTTAVATWQFWPGRTVPERPLQAVPLTATAGYEASPSFSPDGNQVAFSWNGGPDGNDDIYVQMIGSGRPLRLTTNSARDHYPAWSPDGKWIAFLRDVEEGTRATLIILPALGGGERKVAEIEQRGVALDGWSPDGRWLLVSIKQEGLFLISSLTGERRRLTHCDACFNGAGTSYGSISPDGRTLAYFSRANQSPAGGFAGDVYMLALLPDFIPAGSPTRRTRDLKDVRSIVWMADSREVLFSGTSGGSPGLWRMAAFGSGDPTRVPLADSVGTVAISPHAKRLIYEQTVPADTNVWRLDPSSPSLPSKPWIVSTRHDTSARYSPDGTRIAFASTRSGAMEIWVCAADGTAAVQITDKGESSGSPSWSPDGKYVVFDSLVKGKWHVRIVSSDGGEARQLEQAPDSDSARPSWSRDGRWIYFASERTGTGRMEVWKIPAGGGTAQQITKNGGNDPVESDDGKVLYYLAGKSVTRAELDGSGEVHIFDPGPAPTFFPVRNGIYSATIPPDGGVQFFSYETRRSTWLMKSDKLTWSWMAVSPDGKSLLYTQLDGQPGSDLMLVENFR